MKIVNVRASRQYEIIIGSGLLSTLGQHIAKVKAQCTAVIISDSNVWPLYGEKATASLEASGYRVLNFVFPAGEASKCASTYLDILGYLADNKLTRSDMLIALGGGVVGDITGFAAATYLRGISYIQVPTSLLAMVDSSVGGKTAIDLPNGKNLVGAFYQPYLVLCDMDALKSLPTDIFRDGCAEVIKYAILYDPDLFAHLEKFSLNFEREYVISRCVELKRDVVDQDEFDTGARQFLNLGHTLGHGVEAGSNFQLSHGKSVAIGTAIIARMALHLQKCSAETVDKITNILKEFGLPTQTDFSANELYHYALSDKKRSGQTVNLIIPHEIGKCSLLPTEVDILPSYIEAGL